MRNRLRKQTPADFTAEQAGSEEETSGRNKAQEFPEETNPVFCADTRDAWNQGVKDCPCKRSKCPRYGNCEACRVHHAASKRPRPCEKGTSAAGKEGRSRKQQKQG